MPDLAMPVFNREPITSLFGVMRFPDSHEKAGIFASWVLAGALQSAADEQLERLGSDRFWGVQNMARGFPKIAQEAERAGWRGTQAGYLVSYLWNAHQTGVNATLEDAIRAADKSAKRLPGGRSSFMAAKAEFSKVIHFWGMLSNECDNRYPNNVPLFISQSESFLMEMRHHEIGGNTFRSPKYHVQRSDFDWAVSGIEHLLLGPSRIMGSHFQYSLGFNL